MKNPHIALCAVTAALLLRPALAGEGTSLGAQPSLRVQPESIAISVWYEPTEVSVSGELQPKAQVIIVVRGPHTEETFNKKVRIGPLWISSGKVHVSRAPSLFLVFSSKPVGQLLPREVIDEFELDELAVRRRMKIRVEGPPLATGVAAENYHKLKVEEGIYRTHAGRVQIEGGEGPARRYALSFEWPKMAPPANYAISVYQCRNRNVLSVSRASIPARLTGFAATVEHLALHRAAVYGAFAVLFALAAGFLIDFLSQRLFGVKTRAAH